MLFPESLAEVPLYMRNATAVNVSDIPPLPNSLRIPSSPFAAMDEDFLRLSLEAAEVSAILMTGNTTEIAKMYPNATIFTDEPDQAMITKRDGICFVGFRGTLISSREDIQQNFNVGVANDVCKNNQCCPTRQGYRDGFFNVTYFEEFKFSLLECLASCCEYGIAELEPTGSLSCKTNDPFAFEKKCDLVFTGFSQGGSIAQVAAVALQDLDPVTITFGQPPTMESPCPPLDTDKYFRYINTMNEEIINVALPSSSAAYRQISTTTSASLRYDPVPFIEWSNASQSGHAFLLGQNSTGVVYYSDTELPPDISYFDWLPNFLTIHDMSSYKERLEVLLQQNSFPIPLSGFDSGHPCTLDSECSTPESCELRICSVTRLGGFAGDPCSSEADCLPSYTCRGFLSPKCESKVGPNRPCLQASDCLSGICRASATSRSGRCG